MTDLEEAAQNGAKYMDLHRPGWADRININTLDMAQCDRCVRAQILGAFVEPVNAEPAIKGEPNYYQQGMEWWDWAQSLGFACPGNQFVPRPEANERWEQLTGHWIEEIAKRRTPDVV